MAGTTTVSQRVCTYGAPVAHILAKRTSPMNTHRIDKAEE